MKCLLDTHTIIWLATNSDRLSDSAKRAILDAENECSVSIASAWEVAVKCSLGKLRLEGGVSEFFRIISENGFSLIPIKSEHIECVEALPFHHRDPFDRLLVASAVTEEMSVITADENLPKYGIPVIW
jgi:PIN domain nuclease of toxin-antitoxin system